jgi:hypothetical protein
MKLSLLAHPLLDVPGARAGAIEDGRIVRVRRVRAAARVAIQANAARGARGAGRRLRIGVKRPYAARTARFGC